MRAQMRTRRVAFFRPITPIDNAAISIARYAAREVTRRYLGDFVPLFSACKSFAGRIRFGRENQFLRSMGRHGRLIRRET